MKWNFSISVVAYKSHVDDRIGDGFQGGIKGRFPENARGTNILNLSYESNYVNFESRFYRQRINSFSKRCNTSYPILSFDIGI